MLHARRLDVLILASSLFSFTMLDIGTFCCTRLRGNPLSAQSTKVVLSHETKGMRMRLVREHSHVPCSFSSARVHTCLCGSIINLLSTHIYVSDHELPEAQHKCKLKIRSTVYIIKNLRLLQSFPVLWLTAGTFTQGALQLLSYRPNALS